MAWLRLWLWRFAMVAGAVTCGFFVWTALTPFSPPGDPVLDDVITRSRLWQEGGFFLVQLVGVLLWLLSALAAWKWSRALKMLAAGLVLFAGLVAMASEYGSLVSAGALRNPLAVAQHKLMVSRALTLGLAVASLALGWWARIRA